MTDYAYIIYSLINNTLIKKATNNGLYMNFKRTKIATAILSSTLLIGCGSSSDSNTSGNGTDKSTLEDIYWDLTAGQEAFSRAGVISPIAYYFNSTICLKWKGSNRKPSRNVISIDTSVDWFCYCCWF